VAISIDELVRELKAFRESKAVVNAAARGIRKAVAPARRAVKKKAKATLPKGGGLNVWVSKAAIRTSIRLSGRKAGIKITGGRNSVGGRSDIAAIDAGRVRAPSWGHRTRASWHTVTVTPGFFSETLDELPDWRENIEAEVDRALDTIRGR
jgi:hypothetical protein